MTEATEVKGRILWLDANFNSVEKYRIMEIKNGGYDIRAYSSLDKVPTAIREQIEKFDLIIVEPLNTIVTEESKTFYQSFRDRFVELPPLPGIVFLNGMGTVYILRLIAPLVLLLIYTGIEEDTKAGHQRLEELRRTKNVIQIIKKPLYYKDFLAEIEKMIGGKAQEK